MAVKTQGAGQVIRSGIGHAARGGTVVGAAIGVGRSVAENVDLCLDGKKKVSEAAISIAKETGKAGVYGGAVGAGGAVLRQGLARSGMSVLSKGTLPVVMASTAMEIGTATANDFKNYFDGEINGEEMVDRFALQAGKAAGKGIAAWSGAEIGAVVGAVGGPTLNP